VRLVPRLRVLVLSVSAALPLLRTRQSGLVVSAVIFMLAHVDSSRWKGGLKKASTHEEFSNRHS
jgi:hypothetical protein